MREPAVALELFGLDPDEEAVYRALVARPGAHPLELAEAIAHPVGRVEVALTGLVAHGLVSRRADSDHYTAAAPALALGAAVAAQRERLQRAELAVAELVESYRTGTMGEAERELVEVVTGRETVAQRYVQLQLGARQRIDTFVTGRPQAVDRDNTREEAVLARGLKARAVIDRGFLTDDLAVEDVEESLGRGVEVRTMDQIPLRLAVFDVTTAMMPLRGSGAGVDPSIILRGGLAQLAQSLFDAVWARARPYAGPDGVLEDADSRILQLLLAGFTDRAVASQLDLSLRTVQRRTRRLMERAQASSRIQLGWHAREHGWG